MTHRKLFLNSSILGASFVLLFSLISTKLDAAPLIAWGSSESTTRISRSKYNVDFFPLSNNFESQDNGLVCGLAASTIILNALQLRHHEGLPVDESSIPANERAYLPEGYNPFFEKYTQNNILNEHTKRKIEVLGKPIKIGKKEAKDYGLQLRQLAQALQAHGAKVVINVVADDADTEKIKSQLIKNMKTPGDYVLVNYARKSLGQEGGGHISPLAAYDKKSDSFLILDVNTHKAPWVWVAAKDLIEAMRTFDTVENRGFLEISG